MGEVVWGEFEEGGEVTTTKMKLKLSSLGSVKQRDRDSSSRIRHEIFNDHFQNYKRHAIPKAQLVIADIPYNVGKNAYGSNPTS